MAKFTGLIKNEYSKLLKKVSTLVLLIILVAYAFIIPVFSLAAQPAAEELFIPDDMYEGMEWDEKLEEEIEFLKNTIESNQEYLILADGSNKEYYESEIENAEKLILIYEYRLENNIDYDVSEHKSWLYNDDFSFWTIFNMNSDCVSFITIIVIVAAGSIVASEFSKGTIKFLLINPVKRWKILLSKYLTVMSYGYIAIILSYILSFIITLVLYGGGELTAPYLYVSDGVVKSCPGLLYTFGQYMLLSVDMVVSGTLAFAISSLFRSSALSISISIVGSLMGTTVTGILSLLGYNWGKFIIFANTNFKFVIDGQTGFENHTLTMAIAVVVIHLAIFLFAAFKSFTKRQV